MISERFLKKYKGFTLIEILVVIGLIAILAAVTIVAINPQKNFQQARDNERRAEANAILNAVGQYLAEEGNTVAALETAGGGGDGTAGADAFGTCGTDDTEITDNVAVDTADEVTAAPSTHTDLSAALVDEFIVTIPADPTGSGTVGATAVVGYTICKSGTRITIKAPDAEGGSAIEVSR